MTRLTLTMALLFASVAEARTPIDVMLMIDREAERHGVPIPLARAVAKTESDYNAYLVGASGERGAMQVMVPTARWLGFTGTMAELEKPEVNIALGMKYLALAWRKSNGDPKASAWRYNRGVQAEYRPIECWRQWEAGYSIRRMSYPCRVLMNVGA